MISNRYLEIITLLVPLEKINYQFTEFYTGDSVVSEGYTITLGSAGSNQLQIYDKRLERNAKDEPDLDTIFGTDMK